MHAWRLSLNSVVDRVISQNLHKNITNELFNTQVNSILLSSATKARKVASAKSIALHARNILSLRVRGANRQNNACINCFFQFRSCNDDYFLKCCALEKTAIPSQYVFWRIARDFLETFIGIDDRGVLEIWICKRDAIDAGV